jgi:hypothetical protein
MRDSKFRYRLAACQNISAVIYQFSYYETLNYVAFHILVKVIMLVEWNMIKKRVS